MYSIIEWQEGAPKDSGWYIVISEDGHIDVARWYCNGWDSKFTPVGWASVWKNRIFQKE